MKRKTRFRIAALTTALVMSFSINIPGYQVNAEESISELKKENKESEAKRKEAQEKIKQLNAQKNDVLADIEILDGQINEYTAKINDLNSQKNETQAKISVTEVNISTTQAREKNQYNNMKQRIQYAYENGDIAYIDALMAVSEFSDITNQAEYLEQISDYDKSQLEQFLSIKLEHLNYETELQNEYSSLTELMVQAEAEQDALQVIMESKEEKVAAYNASIKDEKTQISRLQAEEQERDNKIAALEKKAEEERKRREEEARKKAAAAAAAAAAAKKNGTTTTTTTSTSSGTVKGTGQLKWPMPASTRISSGFGNRKAPTAGASSYHKGIDIPCAYGSKVIAADSGTVIFTGYNGSAGNAVIVSHGNGMTTLYYHLSGYNCKVGQSVSKGDVIAYSGNSGVSTGPHLHFSVRINGTYVDPRKYL